MKLNGVLTEMELSISGHYFPLIPIWNVGNMGQDQKDYIYNKMTIGCKRQVETK